MDDYNPDDCSEEPFEVTWKDHIERARAGDTAATRVVMHTCILFLKGMGWALNPKDWDPNIPIDAKGCAPRGYVPEPLCSFLLGTLEAAISAPEKSVGEAMGMGKPPQRPKNAEESGEFLDRYSSAVGGEYPVAPSKHSEVLKSIAKRMKLSLRTVQRYWEYYEFIVGEFGLPPPIYEINRDVYEDLQTILNHYQSLINTPALDANTSHRLRPEDLIKKIASDMNQDPQKVERYLDTFDYAVEDIFKLPEGCAPHKELLENLVTFVNRYNSLMNPPHFEDEIALPERRKKTLKMIAIGMTKDLSSVERYWEVFDRTAEDIKAPAIIDDDDY
jgi:hypothetical protein